MQRYGALASLTAILCLGACLEPEATDNVPASVDQASFGGSLGSVLGSPVVGNNTTNLANDNTPSSTCAALSSAPDMAYSWTAPATGTYTFTTTIGSPGSFAPFDTVLDVRNFTTGASLGCNDDIDGTHFSTVSTSLAIGQTVRVIVDGYSTAHGTFYLSISGPPGNAPGRHYRCGYAQAGFGCNNGRAGTAVLAADMTAAVPACQIAQPSNLPDFCNVIDLDGATASDSGQCAARGGSWRPNTACCNFVGSVTCPN